MAGRVSAGNGPTLNAAFMVGDSTVIFLAFRGGSPNHSGTQL